MEEPLDKKCKRVAKFADNSMRDCFPNWFDHVDRVNGVARYQCFEDIEEVITSEMVISTLLVYAESETRARSLLSSVKITKIIVFTPVRDDTQFTDVAVVWDDNGTRYDSNKCRPLSECQVPPVGKVWKRVFKPPKDNVWHGWMGFDGDCRRKRAASEPENDNSLKESPIPVFKCFGFRHSFGVNQHFSVKVPAGSYVEVLYLGHLNRKQGTYYSFSNVDTGGKGPVFRLGLGSKLSPCADEDINCPLTPLHPVFDTE